MRSATAKLRFAGAVAAFTIAGAVVVAETQSPKRADELPKIAELPNPFVFADGSPVRTKDDWPRRRAELKGLFEDYEYGYLPPKPERMNVERGERIVDSANGVALEVVVLRIEHAGKALALDVLVALPSSAQEKVPVIIRGAFRGWPGQGALPPPGERLKPFTSRGYGVAEIDFQQVAPDSKEQSRTGGAYHLFGSEIDCGALMAWAWAVHRVVDAIETIPTIPELDATKIVVTGHSRYGKAALVAGAFDERIALTAPSHSGCAGCAPFRFIYGNSEQLHNIVGGFPYWFRPDFNQFVGNVNRLPLDQHLLMALVAPRALLQTEGTEDAWTNPEGAQMTHLAAKKVYEFLDAGERISVRYRPVGHIPSNDDLLEFADHVFFNKRLSEEFDRLPYPEAKNGYAWDVPK